MEYQSTTTSSRTSSVYPQPTAPPMPQEYPRSYNTTTESQRPSTSGYAQDQAYAPRAVYQQQAAPSQSERIVYVDRPAAPQNERVVYVDRPAQYQQQSTAYVERPAYGQQPFYNTPPQVIQQETVYSSGPQQRGYYQQQYAYGPPPPAYGPAPYGFGPQPYAQQQPVIINETNVYENGPGYNGGYGGGYGGGFNNLEAGLLGAGGGLLGGLLIADLID